MQFFDGRSRVLIVLACALLMGAAAVAAEEALEIEPVLASELPAATEVKSDESDRSDEGSLPELFADGLEIPEPQPMTCSATANCQFGSISCSGGCPADRRHSSCPPGQSGTIGWVKCGGYTEYCAPCTCQPSCKSQCGLTGGACNNGICYCY